MSMVFLCYRRDSVDEYGIFCVAGGTVWMSMVFLCYRRDSVDEYGMFVLQKGQC